MHKGITAAAAAVLFVAGVGVGVAASVKAASSPSLFQGKSNQEAARALLDTALVQAGKGSWERIAVGRAWYLGGDKAKGQQIFDALLAGKHDDGDAFRIARVYEEAGEWNKAKPMFDAYLAGNPNEAKDLAEVGAYYYLHGDKATGEQLFARAFDADDNEVWATIQVAGAYLGLKPQP
ncbi:MAG: tetratricopeptide repeat protein [Lysobacteraceae bacterium]